MRELKAKYGAGTIPRNRIANRPERFPGIAPVTCDTIREYVRRTDSGESRHGAGWWGGLEGPFSTTDGSELRRLYNRAYSDRVYERVRRAMAERLDTPDFAAPLVGTPEPFGLAETPVLFSPALRDRCHRAAIEILEQMRQPEVVAACTGASRKPSVSPAPTASRTRSPSTSRSCVARMERSSRASSSARASPRLRDAGGAGRHLGRDARRAPGSDRGFTTYWPGIDRAQFIELLRRTIVGGADPAEVVLLDIDPRPRKPVPISWPWRNSSACRRSA